jgi:hypothetical protein
MGKRILAGILWFFAGWYLGAFVAHLMGQPDVLGPIWGASAAFLFAVDPKGYIWTRPTPEAMPATADRATATAEPAT